MKIIKKIRFCALEIIFGHDSENAPYLTKFCLKSQKKRFLIGHDKQHDPKDEGAV